jgi:hypothetical protein
MTDRHASALAKKRWAKTTKAQRAKVAKMLTESKTPAERRAIAKKAVAARWAKAKKLRALPIGKKSVPQGTKNLPKGKQPDSK